MANTETGLPVKTLTNGDVAVKIVDKTTVSQALAVDANGLISDKLNDGAGNPITSQVSGSQRALDVGIDVAGVQVDPRQIRALTSADVVSANIRDATGTAFSTTNPLPVLIADSVPGTDVNDYSPATAVVPNSPSNHDYTITSLKTMHLKKVVASCLERLQIDVQISPDGTTFTTKFTAFNSQANPTIQIDMDQLDLTDSGAGAKIRIIRTNLGALTENIYSTICGYET